MTSTTKGLVLALALAASGTLANATPLNFLPTTTVASVSTFLGGTELAFAATPISNTSYNGTARSAVYREAGGTLDFYYQFTNNPSSANGVERFTGYDFSSLGAATVNVFQTGAAFGSFVAGTETADYADRTALGVIAFSFVPSGHTKINPGVTSFTEIVQTNARDWKVGNFGLLDGIGDNGVGFAPVSPVPEPGTYLLLLAGLGVMTFVARRRQAAI